MPNFITESKHPERQRVLDYMDSYGIHIYDAGSFCMIKGDIHPNELMRLTNFKGKKRDGWVLIELPDGTVFKGGTKVQAMAALEYLYNIMRTAEADSDF